MHTAGKGAGADEEGEEPSGGGTEADGNGGRKEELPREDDEGGKRAFKRGTKKGLASFVGAGKEFAAKGGEDGGGFGPGGCYC